MYYYPNNTQQNYEYNMQQYNNAGQILPVGYGGYNNSYNMGYSQQPQQQSYDYNMQMYNQPQTGYTQQLQQSYGYNMQQYNQPQYQNYGYNMQMYNQPQTGYTQQSQMANNIGANAQYNPYNNGGYYSGYYGNFNPYDLQKQQQLQIEEYNKQQQYQVNMWKTLYKAACTYTNTEVTKESLEFYDRFGSNQNSNSITGPDLSDLTYEQRIEYNTRRNNDIRLEQNQRAAQNTIINMELRQLNNQYDPLQMLNMAVNEYNRRVYEKERERVPEDTDLFTYLNKYASWDYYNALQNINKKRQTTAALYNSKDYNDLLSRHKNTLFGNALNPNASLDDQEIHLPTSISDEQRQERRARFFDSIMKNQANGGAIHG